jgi:hypothetical protein
MILKGFGLRVPQLTIFEAKIGDVHLQAMDRRTGLIIV